LDTNSRISSSLQFEGADGLEGVLGPLLQQPADGFSSANPRPTNYAEHNFLDQNPYNRSDVPFPLISTVLNGSA
jgi:hypothetical protein